MNPTNSVDNEWSKFLYLTSQETITFSNDTYINDNVICIPPLQNDILETDNKYCEAKVEPPPNPTDLYISTKSKIAYLNQNIDLKKMFWNISLIPYCHQQNGVIKKQIKYISESAEELEKLKETLKNESYFQEQIITSINNPNGRIKFKDIRKISVGLSKKDILSFRCKKKSAFYNCFVMIIRYKLGNTFKEFHIKVFNTGKLKIPGIQSEETFTEISEYIISILQPFMSEKLEYKRPSDNVLINSNFNCGFYINQDVLFNLLKYTYNIQCIYDPCSYPGIQCKFYYNYETNDMSGHQLNNMTIKENKKSSSDTIISFMIFRTGSILISGKCDEFIINKIYEFIKNLLMTEYNKIVVKKNDKYINQYVVSNDEIECIDEDNEENDIGPMKLTNIKKLVKIPKTKKLRKKNIYISSKMTPLSTQTLEHQEQKEEITTLQTQPIEQKI